MFYYVKICSLSVKTSLIILFMTDNIVQGGIKFKVKSSNIEH